MKNCILHTAIITPLVMVTVQPQPVFAREMSNQTTPSAEVILVASQQSSQPFTLEMVEGKHIITRQLQLRSREKLQALQKRKWFAGHYLPANRNHFSVPKPGVSKSERHEALKFARDHLTASFQQIEAFLKQSYQAPELTAHFFSDLDVAIDILQAVGTRGDEKRLLDFVMVSKSAELKNSWNTLQPSQTALIAGISVAMRLGKLPQSAFVQQWRKLRGKNSDALFTSMTIELAKLGYQPALDVLIDAVAVTRSNASWHERTNAKAFKVISQVEHPAVLELSVEIVKTFANDAEMIFRGEKKYYSTTDGGISVRSVFAAAFLYVASFGSDEQRQVLKVGLIKNSPIPELLSFFEDPIKALDFHFGVSSKQFYKRYSFSICELAEGRNRREFHELMAKYQNEFFEWFGLHNLQKQWRNHRGGVANWHVAIAYARSQCMINAKAMGYLQGSYKHPVFRLPAYMLHASDKIKDEFPNFEKYPHAPLDKELFDHVDDENFAKLIKRANIAFHPSVVAYQYRRKVVTSAYFARRSQFPGVDDERLFAEPVAIQAGKSKNYWIAGSIKLLPRTSAKRRLFGLKIDASPHAAGGLETMIGKYFEKMAPLIANSGRALVDQVKLRHGETESDLEYKRTSQQGIHVFELKDDVSSESNLVVDVYMKTIDKKWVVSFPLYASAYGFRKVLSEGRISLLGK